jgi:hypothetical protein
MNAIDFSVAAARWIVRFVDRCTTDRFCETWTAPQVIGVLLARIELRRVLFLLAKNAGSHGIEVVAGYVRRLTKHTTTIGSVVFKVLRVSYSEIER